MIRTIAKFIFGLILLLLLIYIILALFSKPADDHPFFENDSVLVMAHQGGKGLWPDNTMYAFEHAAELGVDVLVEETLEEVSLLGLVVAPLRVIDEDVHVGQGVIELI
ncbi:MAG: hypothetical protein ACK2T3_13640, partial [Candidatus Promineifilaceae bacterium]